MKKFLLSMLIAFAAISCIADATTDVAPAVETPETITVSFDDEDSRIELNESLKTVWTAGDQVSVFYKSDANDCFQFDGKTGDRSGTLSRVLQGTHTQERDNISILYPYNAEYKLMGNGEILAKFSATQNYKKDSFGVGSSLMVAESEDAQFALKNVCGWLKLQFTGTGKVRNITLEGNKGEQVAGNIYVNTADASSRLLYSPSGELGDDEVGGSLIIGDNIIKRVTLNCGEGVTLNGETPTSFYIALPPQTFDEGVKISVEGVDGSIIEKSTTKTLSIERNNIQPMASVELQFLYVDEDVQILQTHYEGADIAVTFPATLKAKGHRIKWGITNKATIGYNGVTNIVDVTHRCEDVYPCLIDGDTTLHINHYNAYRRTANGEIGYYYYSREYVNGEYKTIMNEVSADDPRVETGEATTIQNYELFTPGEPLVLMMSEVAYADGANLLPTIDYGWGPGWYWYPYDYESYRTALATNSNIDANAFWHEGAWYKKIEFRLPTPSQFDGSVEVTCSQLTPDDGVITFTPDSKTFAYIIGVFEDGCTDAEGGYQYTVNKILGGDESLVQWLSTSRVGSFLGFLPLFASDGVQELKLSEIFSKVSPEMKYHVVVTAVGGSVVDGKAVLDLSSQNYQHIEFSLPDYTLNAPELIVTPYESYSPYRVKFNIKNANLGNLVKKVVYAANYTRDFDNYKNAYAYTYADVIMANDDEYWNLGDEEINQVNSDYGFDVEFDVRENSAFTLAVKGWNTEGLPSNPDKEGSKAVAEAHSTSMPAADALDMTKLNALKGDWTATATIQTEYCNTSVKRWKVSIGDLNANQTLAAEEYALFESYGVNKAMADGYLAEFNQLSADYNASVLGQNRVLCQGWDISGERETSTASPWDLFLMTDYNASQVSYLFHDFGPKWFLQTDADGNIFVPVNYNVVPPMMSWYNGVTHYLCGCNYENAMADYINPNAPLDVQSVGIPVEISEDGNTIILKSRVVESATLYPGIVYDMDCALSLYSPYVISEVVLTRGWNESSVSTLTAKHSIGNYESGKRLVNGENFKTPQRPYAKTVFLPKTKLVKAKQVDAKALTVERLKQSMQEYLYKRKQLFGRD